MFSSDATGRLGVHGVALAIVELGWFFREQPISDFGIDAQIEAPDRHGHPSGRLIAVQIKAGRSWFREPSGEGVVYRGHNEHLEYWRRHSLPVIIVLCDIEKKTCFWQAVTPEAVEATRSGWKLVVPLSQKLDRGALPLLERICKAPADLWAKSGSGRGVSAGPIDSQLLTFSAAYSRVTISKVGKKYRPELYVARGPDAEIWEFLTDFRAANARAWIVKEKAGSGKTNLVCNLANRLLGDGFPCVFMLGSQPLANRMELAAEAMRALGLDPGNGERMAVALDRLRQVLDAMPLTPVCVLIDAINETRDVELMRDALNELCAQFQPLRVRILITCRDIYWSFLEGDWLGVIDASVRTFDLYRYDMEAWPTVRDRYFAAYRIAGQLVGDAEETCRQPLLFRFFCEAYEGEDVSVVANIRLQPLFEKYLEKKVERLAAARGDLFRAAESVTGCLQSIAAEMLDTHDVSVPEKRATVLTGDTGRLDSQSLYVRLLDEDIILDEFPDTRRNQLARRVRFVYEAFLEFMLARELASRYDGLTNDEVMQRLVPLLDPNTGMRNVRGALTFLEDFFEERRLPVWRELAERAPVWQGVVLASLREADPGHLPAMMAAAYPVLVNAESHETRAEAVSLLANSYFARQVDPDYEQFFRSLLHDRRLEVRLAAARVVPVIWDSLNDAQQVAACRIVLDPAKAVRKQGFDLIPKLSGEGRARLFQEFCAALSAPQGRVRSFAVIALDLGLWPEARGRLLEALGDENPWVRRAALIQLKMHRAEADAPAIAAKLADPHPGVRKLAAIVVKTWRYPTLAPALEQQIAVEPDNTVLARMAEALVRLKSSGSPEILRGLLSHPNYWVRVHAGKGLYQAMGMEAIPFLAQAMSEHLLRRWIGAWPGIEEFGGAKGIAALHKAKFKRKGLDPEAAAFIGGLFLREAVEERPDLLDWLSANLAKLPVKLRVAYIHGVRAGAAGGLLVGNAALRGLLSQFLRTGPDAVRVETAYLLGQGAASVSEEELDRMLSSGIPGIREALAWGISHSEVAAQGWKQRVPEPDFLSDEDESSASTVPSWGDLLARGFPAPGERA